ncbi:MAG TPA: OmpA family protein [Saprospiraceae bacterium]|mgnify:CR=1 FL=1|nr:OmpA family protein [Saprospiraceae bacterium]HMP25343.1 OmpA family protein [Saprospiraceae bacterium]
MRIVVIFLFLSGWMMPGWGQQSYTTKKTADSKVIKLWERVEHYSAAEHFDDALKELSRIFRMDSTFIDGHIRWGAIKYTQQEFAEAEIAYRNALTMSNEYDTNIFYQLALTYYNQNKFAEAIPWLERFVATPPRNERLRTRAEKHLENCRFAARAVQNPVPFRPERLSANINTPNPEYLPALTADEQFLIYTTYINGQEDFYFSEKVNGEWQKGKPLEAVNTPLNEGAQSISADGKLLVFTACERPDGMGRCDLYYSESKNGAWTKPRNIGPPVNSAAWESQPSLSADGQALYFSSNRPGSIGGSDLWVSYRQTDGRWGQPQNLGPTINTPDDDQAPFIHPDGQTLYFMSKGHPGMGGFDLFVARRQADGSWGQPQNLGYPVNTRANEGALIVSMDGKTAYYATDEGDAQHANNTLLLTRKNADIFSFELHPEARAQPVTYVRAKVFDATTRRPLEAAIEFTELKNSRPHTSAMTGPEGEFLVCLPLGRAYALNVNREGYLFHSENFDLSEQTTITEPFLLEIGLIPISEEPSAERPAPVVLRNVFFETGSAALRPESKAELNRLKTLLETHPKMKIRINGHTDNVGAEAANLQLSEQRAKAVYDYLLQNGIAAERLGYKGFGESLPIDTNDTPAGRQRNRRTEFELQ